MNTKIPRHSQKSADWCSVDLAAADNQSSYSDFFFLGLAIVQALLFLLHGELGLFDLVLLLSDGSILSLSIIPSAIGEHHQ